MVFYMRFLASCEIQDRRKSARPVTIRDFLQNSKTPLASSIGICAVAGTAKSSLGVRAPVLILEDFEKASKPVLSYPQPTRQV